MNLKHGRWLSCLFVLAATSGCSFSFQKWQYQAAVKNIEAKQYSEAIRQMSRIVRRAPESPLALEASRRASRAAVYDLKDYNAALEFLKHLILYSPDAVERVSAQKSMADLYFEKLLNYDEAIAEYSRLLGLLETKERLPYKLRISRAYYNLNNFSQALIEVDSVLDSKPQRDLYFEALLFKGNLMQAAKRVDDAVKVFSEIIRKFPERADQEHVAVNLAVCYEEKGEFAAAIQVLENLKRHYPNPEFLEVRISGLRGRMANQPGAQGVKK